MELPTVCDAPCPLHPVDPDQLREALLELAELQDDCDCESECWDVDEVESFSFSAFYPTHPREVEGDGCLPDNTGCGEILDLDEFMASHGEVSDVNSATSASADPALNSWCGIGTGSMTPEATVEAPAHMECASGSGCSSAESRFVTPRSWEELEKCCWEMDEAGEGALQGLDLTFLLHRSPLEEPASLGQSPRPQQQRTFEAGPRPVAAR